MGHVTNQYYEIMQKTGMASIVALTTKKNPFPQEKVNYLLITGQMKYDSSEYATLKEKSRWRICGDSSCRSSADSDCKSSALGV